MSEPQEKNTLQLIKGEGSEKGDATAVELWNNNSVGVRTAPLLVRFRVTLKMALLSSQFILFIYIGSLFLLSLCNNTACIFNEEI